MSSGKLKEINTKLQSLKATVKVTKAMQLMASAKLLAAKKRLGNADNYCLAIENILDKIPLNKTDSSNFLLNNIFQKSQNGVDLIIAISPDKGFCGAVNNAIKKKFDKLALESKLSNFEVGLYGHKIIQHAEKNHSNLQYNKIQNLEEFLINILSTKPIKSIKIIYTKFYSIVKNSPEIYEFKSRKTNEYQEQNSDILIEQNPKILMANVAKMLIKATAEMIICNSNLSEISSRMTAMDAATRNGNKLITSLSLKKNKLRQAKITNELIDIVSGANAI